MPRFTAATTGPPSNAATATAASASYIRLTIMPLRASSIPRAEAPATPSTPIVALPIVATSRRLTARSSYSAVEKTAGTPGGTYASSTAATASNQHGVPFYEDCTRPAPSPTGSTIAAGDTTGTRITSKTPAPLPLDLAILPAVMASLAND
ncbi:hypothetical protein ACFZAV_39835 [Streptomyces sp. NPDC008343]|uniref:hypothetical protein n=1 Tax=Streptomyces sp. NPDC008343 TaxID=3364828 RepID=UPI0036EF79A6